VRRFAREIGIDISQVAGSGPKGRISVDDVKTFAKQVLSGASTSPANAQQRGGAGGAVGIAVPPLPDFSKWGAIDRQPMSPLRKKATELLTHSWTTIPHVTQFDKADITELEKLRKRFVKKAEAKGGKLTITPFLLKVIGAALKVFPQFNASLDLARGEIIYKKYFNIGVAVDTDRGLIVPVVRDVDKKDIFDLATELNQIAEKARNRKTTIEEMQGNTFTLTNLGGIGGTCFTPIVNWPDVAILGVSRAAMEPVYMEGQLVPRFMLPLSLSYDHRVIDGADGARFLRWVAEAIQQPLLMELEG
jgi:pyruvate dehydrogenase E2 component (dihydrolipoamide acetyltransferase)